MGDETMNQLTLGSLFDGIGGFPLSALRYGIVTKWASEIEPFPMRATAHHFPDMKHLGDITKINGAEIEPVDIISFGSPCQDMSVAGKRAGLEGKRSGLFMEAVRIIQEMRFATNGVYPRFAIWENVPGAFSSNGGADFRAVLEELAEAEIPMPLSGKWAESGMVRGNGREICWRVLDAQYWGVPQRRKRIFLVADFAGQCAHEILFIEQGVSGNSEQSREAREEVAVGAGDSLEKPIDRMMFENHSQDTRYVGPLKVSQTISATFGMGGNNTPFIVEPSRINCQPGGISGTVSSKWAKGTGGPAGDEHYNLIVLSDQGGSRMDISEGVCPTLRAQTHNHEPIIAFSAGQSAKAGSLGIAEEISPTLRAGQSGTNMVPTIAFAANQRDEVRDLGDKSGALQAEPGMKQQTFVIQSATMPSKSQNGLGITDGACYTLDCRADHAVAQPIAFDGYNQTVSNTAQTIRSNKNDGDHVGMVLQPVVAYPNPANTLLAKANMSFRGDTDNIVAQAVDVRNLRETEELSGTLQAKENGGYSLNYTNPVRIGYAVRRLTPVECLRLQGFPDNWLDIEGASDSVKYKAIGNSVAVPCVEFIFSQIVKVLERK